MVSKNLDNRNALIGSLRRELVGPSPYGFEIAVDGDIFVEDDKDLWKPWRQKGSGEEILTRDAPLTRYGVGVLYPIGVSSEIGEDEELAGSELDEYEVPDSEPMIGEAVVKQLESVKERLGSINESDEPDIDLALTNTYKQSAMGLSFLADIVSGSVLYVEVSGGYYVSKVSRGPTKRNTWWLRCPTSFEVEFQSDLLSTENAVTLTRSVVLGGITLAVEVISRPAQTLGTRLVTVCLVNRTSVHKAMRDEVALFQSSFACSFRIGGSTIPAIMPYPEADLLSHQDSEELSLRLLYQNSRSFAVGHGCSADWELDLNCRTKAMIAKAECLPVFETPSITPEVTRPSGTAVLVSMASLAGLVAGDDGFGSLEEVIGAYSGWIESKRKEAEMLEQSLRSVAQQHLLECEYCLNRMSRGVAYLRQNATAYRAFQLANYAVLLQQVATQKEARIASFDPSKRRLEFSRPYSEPNPLEPPRGRGYWRPFQIAFMLMNIRAMAEPSDPDREVVDLVWFPTGGGKTEAYLGLAAYSMFLRRLSNPLDVGVSVIMRYTLRLLTAQQFERASRLICAMEHIRRKHSLELGDREFSIGIWVGGETTPNRRKNAVAMLARINKGKAEENAFLLDRCPWCGAQIGEWAYPRKSAVKLPRVIGYAQVGDTVAFSCSDAACEFRSGLPVYVIDEDIYEELPSILIGTVDKFATLPWRPQASVIFGISTDGQRFVSPPSLIIQDELHLISGPLGSMVGLYETAIHEFCVDDRNGKRIVPKIVCSTATTRRYQEQVRSLFAREEVRLFPPPGLDADDSFFARVATNKDGLPAPGRMYVGVHAPGFGSLQTAQVRTMASLLQTPYDFISAERDPWWTVVTFCNSFRVLGTTLSLLQSDIPDYLKVHQARAGRTYSEMRSLHSVEELTSRLRHDQIPKAIRKLEVNTEGEDLPVDVCLASSMIEVGIDIDRLSCMVVIGQPKNTSQYIQVTGRVGRQWSTRPGLVVTIYSPTNPRDRSHFEKFRSYHERLYAQVEPSSVTPFSAQALDRALHAVMVAYVRVFGGSSVAESPYPFPDAEVHRFLQVLSDRISIVDPDEMKQAHHVLRNRIAQWKRWQRTNWQYFESYEDPPLLRLAGAYATSEWASMSWPTPTSMRNVDAECRAEVTLLYAQPYKED